MAKSINGFFGKYTGKVGTVIFSSWKGIPYMRSHQKSYRSNTPAQQLQRKKFKLVRRFINIIKPVINAGFKWDLKGKTELNSAMSYIMKWAMKGGLEDLEINYPAVLVAKGDLPPATGGQVAVTAEGNLHFSWENAGDSPDDRATDKALILAYCPKPSRRFGRLMKACGAKPRNIHWHCPRVWKAGHWKLIWPSQLPMGRRLRIVSG